MKNTKMKKTAIQRGETLIDEFMTKYNKWRILRSILAVLKYASALVNIVQLVQFFMG